MNGKVAPLPFDATSLEHGALGSSKKGERRSRVFKAITDTYEFGGWSRMWLAVVWFVLATVTVSYRYPAIAGTFHSSVKAVMTSYEMSNGDTADVRTQNTFYGGLTHALGFLTAYADKADAAGHAEGTLPVTEYDKILFARLEVDFKSNCLKEYKKYGLSCYHSGLDPGTGSKLDDSVLQQLTGTDGLRKIELLNPQVTRKDLKQRIAQVIDKELLFLSTYGFRASLLIGVANTIAEDFRTVYLFTVTRKSNDAIGSQSLRSVMTLIDNVDVRRTPIYTNGDDYRRAVTEVLSIMFLLHAIWSEVLQFSICRAWLNLNKPSHGAGGMAAAAGGERSLRWRRPAPTAWFFFSQPWNLVDLLALGNFVAWWVVYAILLVKSYNMEVDLIHTLHDFDAVRSYADFHLQHLVWGIFTSLLVGLRVLPHFKSHGGLSVYSLTLKLSWQRLKDLMLFFGYVYFLMTVLISPIFELTGANTLFQDTGTGILNVALMTFQYMGFTDFFANNAPTFGNYWLIYMFFFWVVVLILVVISQNVLLALVAGAYEEAREVVGEVEFTQLQLSLYRLWWIAYSRWHRWLLRKSPYELVEQLLAAVSHPDVPFYKHVFVRSALADLPEARLLAQLYTDPASEILYMYSPWAWHRSSPGDIGQQAPWHEQLDYPMYSWEDVPINESGGRPRLLRLPPLFTRDPPEGRPAARGRLPVSYSEADDLFAMTEEEVDQLLESVEWCWGRMQHYRLLVRFTGMGWSETGRKLLREGLLEVYRRRRLDEMTTSTVGEDGFGASSGRGSGALVAEVDEPSGPAIKASGSQTVARGPAGGRGGGGGGAAAAPDVGSGGTAAADAAAADAAAALAARNRQFSLFNRRGRIAENLDLLWGEVQGRFSELQGQVSELRRHQAEVKALLELLLRQLQLQPQEHQQRGSPSAGGPGSVSRNAGGGGGNGGEGPMRGPAALATERPVSGRAATRSRALWEQPSE